MPYIDGLPQATSVSSTDLFAICRGSTGAAGSGITDSVSAQQLGLFLASFATQFSSIAELQAVSHTVLADTICYVSGYYAPGDGGGGIYWYNATDTTSSGNGGSIIVDAAAHRWYLNTQGEPFTAAQFGGTTSASDIGAPINAAAAALALLGTGGVIRVPAGSYNQTTPVVITTSNITVVGDGKGGWHDSGSVNYQVGATNITWMGANGATMFKFAAPTSGPRLVGCGVLNICLVSGVYPFSSAAAVGVSINSVAFGAFDVMTVEFTGTHVDFEVVTGLTEDCNNEGNEVTIVFRALATAGTILKLGGTTSVGNTTMNHFAYVGGQYFNGMVVDWAACDNNRMDFCEGFKAAGGTGTLMTFRGQRASGGEFARQNVIYWLSEQTGGGVIEVEGTNTSGVVGASVQNQIVFFDYGDDSPDIVTGTGTSFWYGSDEAPISRDYENFTTNGGGGTTVSSSRLSEVWGTLVASGAGDNVVSVTAFGNVPVAGIQNVQLTPLQGSTTAYVVGADTTGTTFTVNVSGAGSWYWRAVVI